MTVTGPCLDGFEKYNKIINIKVYLWWRYNTLWRFFLISQSALSDICEAIFYSISPYIRDILVSHKLFHEEEKSFGHK